MYDAGDFSVLTSYQPRVRQEKWVGGQFISPERVIIFGSSGKSYLFKLPNKLVKCFPYAVLNMSI